MLDKKDSVIVNLIRMMRIVEECACIDSKGEETSISQIEQLLDLMSRRKRHTFHTCRSWEVSLGFGQAETVRDKQDTIVGMRND